MLHRLGFAGRIIAIVLLALLVLVAASAIISMALTWQRSETESWVALPERAAAVVELLDRADQAQRKLLLKALNSETASVSVTAQRPIATSDQPRLTLVEWVLARFIPHVGRREIIITLDRADAARRTNLQIGQLKMFAREPLQVAISLTNGDWVIFQTRVEISSRVLGWPPGFVIGAIGALVGIFAILAIAREARPLADLAGAVSRFAQDARPHPIPARGAPEVRLLIGAVNDMQQRIANLLRGRTILLGAISHDLKTFITRLRLRVEGLAEGEAQDKAIRDLDDMTALIDDALAIAKGSAVSERRQPIELVALLADEIAERRDGPTAFELVRRGGPVILDGDATALRRLFGNLMDNAAQQATVVHIDVARRGLAVVVTIDDNGCGIPAAERSAVFEPFYRVDASRSRATGGSGLGLAIAKQIVDAHGGEITVDSAPLGGARLVVRFPTTSGR